MSMTSKERIRAAVRHVQTDVLPTHFECVPSVMESLKRGFVLKVLKPSKQQQDQGQCHSILI